MNFFYTHPIVLHPFSHIELVALALIQLISRKCIWTIYKVQCMLASPFSQHKPPLHLLLVWGPTFGMSLCLNTQEPLKRSEIRQCLLVHSLIQMLQALKSNLAFIWTTAFDKLIFINPVITQIWLSILPSSCYTFPFNLVTRIWCQIKITFWLPVCRIIYGYYWEKWHANHLQACMKLF